VDGALGQMLKALDDQHLRRSTGVIVGAKHGQYASAVRVVMSMVSVKLREALQVSKSEHGALVSPNAGNTLKQPLDRHGSGPVTGSFPGKRPFRPPFARWCK
jgi:hypothetical protein